MSEENKKIKIKRIWAMPSAWTFTIKPIKELLEMYVDKEADWIDPFAGENSPAKWKNDINPERNAQFHLDAFEFAKNVERLTGVKKFDGCLFDPPYSNRQISEHYKQAGIKASRFDTSARFYSRIKKELAPKIKSCVISFGWNSGGFGKVNGFEVIEILLVPHGGAKNDTIVTVERKIV